MPSDEARNIVYLKHGNFERPQGGNIQGRNEGTHRRAASEERGKRDTEGGDRCEGKVPRRSRAEVGKVREAESDKQGAQCVGGSRIQRMEDVVDNRGCLCRNLQNFTSMHFSTEQLGGLHDVGIKGAENVIVRDTLITGAVGGHKRNVDLFGSGSG
ncbi:hypothetical protein B0H17DRAFT_1124005 [Mycena rosella]|uniref:Uncharacterized protein n=1 Tax=Mycena rosella TaxID=1033263 RepID=A0AAD7MCM6_MYCRO|nr:hypothetical protein B0H17DRAFT_1124005 [Mycena rosella]